MNSKKIKIHILFEYGEDLRPHGSAFIRLLRPLTHQSLRNRIDVTYGISYEGQKVDIVLIDRLWRSDVTIKLVKKLVSDVHYAQAKLIYSLDDNFFDLPPNRIGEFTEEQLDIVAYLIHNADLVHVTTPILKELFLVFNQNVIVIPLALDERLIIQRKPGRSRKPFNAKRKIIGYMGTLTHDDDLEMVLPALESICKKYPDEIEIQIIGGIGRISTKQDLSNLPVYYIEPEQEENEYPLFMLWYTSKINWDIAIAPLNDNRFNRSKSDIKFLDYSAIGVPGVYSKVPAYFSSIQHLETGWLAGNQVDSWINALETLLNDDELREKLARNASRYLFSQRTLARCAQLWLEPLKDLMVLL